MRIDPRIVGAVFGATVTLVAIFLLAGCGTSTGPILSPTNASKAQMALTAVELAESAYFLETNASPALQAKATAANNLAQAAITQAASSSLSIGTANSDVSTAFSVLEDIANAYAGLSTTNATNVAKFQALLPIAQSLVTAALAAS